MSQKYIAMFLSFLIVSLSVAPVYVYAHGEEEGGTAPHPTNLGCIRINSNPTDATYQVINPPNNRVIYELPTGKATPDDLEPGDFNIKVRKNGYQETSSTIKVIGGSCAAATITMQLLSASTSAQSSPAPPSGTDVSFNTQPLLAALHQVASSGSTGTAPGATVTGSPLDDGSGGICGDINLNTNPTTINLVLHGGEETSSFNCPRQGRTHGAIDLAPRSANYIRAPEAGRLSVQPNGGDLGEYVELTTSTGVWKFGHLVGVNNPPRFIKRNGDQVIQCDPIGVIYTGATRAGESRTGTHVHVEYTENGAQIDPAAKLQSIAAASNCDSAQVLQLPAGIGAPAVAGVAVLQTVTLNLNSGDKACIGKPVEIEVIVSGSGFSPNTRPYVVIVDTRTGATTQANYISGDAGLTKYKGSILNNQPGTFTILARATLSGQELSSAEQPIEIKQDSSCNAYHAYIQLQNPHKPEEDLSRATLTLQNGQCERTEKFNTWYCTSSSLSATVTIEVPNVNPSIPAPSSAPSRIFSITTPPSTTAPSTSASSSDVSSGVSSSEVATDEVAPDEVAPGDEACRDAGGICEFVQEKTGGRYVQGLCTSNTTLNYQCWIQDARVVDCASCNRAYGWCSSGSGGYCNYKIDPTNTNFPNSRPTCIPGYSLIWDAASCPSALPATGAVVAKNLAGEVSASIQSTSPSTAGRRIPIQITFDLQSTHPTAGTVIIPIEPNFALYSQCEVCTLNSYKWCSQASRPSSPLGTCKPATEQCGPTEATFFDENPNDDQPVKCPAQIVQEIIARTDSSKDACEAAVQNGYVWCRNQDGSGFHMPYNTNENLNTVCGPNTQPILNKDACSKVDDIIENIVWNEVIAFATRYAASRSTPKFIQPPNDWEPTDGIEIPAAITKKRGTHVCEDVSAAKINGELDKTNALSSEGSTPLFQAGDPISIKGNVEKYSSTCNGLNLECRDHQILGCKVSDKLFYISLKQQKCSGEYPDTIYKEMEHEKIWDWGFIATVVAGAVLPFFLTDVDTGVSPSGQPGSANYPNAYSAARSYDPYAYQYQYRTFGSQAGSGTNMVGIVNSLRGSNNYGSQKEWIMRTGIGIVTSIFSKPDATKERCFTVCGKTYQTKDPSRDTCETYSPPRTTTGTQVKRDAAIPGPKITLSYKEIKYDEEFGCAKNTACGAFANARVDVSLITPSGAVAPLDDTRTDSLGNYDVSFNAPSVDGTFNTVLKVKGVPPVQSATNTQTTGTRDVSASQLGGRT